MTIFPKDRRQSLRFRRSLLAGVAAVALTLIFWIAGEFGMARLAPEQLMLLLVLFWIGNFTILGIIRSGFNLRFNDPSLTLLQILWSLFWVMLLTYYLDEARPAALMLALLIINFGAFRLNLLQLSGLSGLAIAAYALVILLLSRNHPDTVGLRNELFVLAGFAAALCGTALVGQEMFTLRKIIGDRNRRLEEALEQVNRLALTDELTGAFNRRYLLEVLAKQKALADRGNYNFSLCFFDVDHFKKVNDELGHAAGDEVLKRVARVTHRIIRDGDYLARYGGEEFVLVLAGTVGDKAAIVAERIRSTVDGESYRDIGPELRVTISAGVTEFRRNENVAATIARSDDAMYKAKKKGRNAVVLA